jgi:hypothetical protein
MSPAQWAALVLLAIGVCWLAGVFVELSRDEPRRTKEEIDADVEAMLKEANQDVTQRPRVRAGGIND